MNRSCRVALSVAFVAFTAATAAPPAPPLPIPNARTPIAGVVSGGQPTRDDISAAAAAGFKTVINMRAPSEPGFDWEPEAVRTAGMDYVSIPVAGAADLTREKVAELDAVLKQAGEKGPAVLHCASGNRIGAMLALRAAWLSGMDPAAALEYGRASGLTGLEPAVRKILGLGDSTSAPR